MTSLLPSLFIDGHEFSIAELSAARLDGDLVGVGAAFVPVGALVDHRHRAASIALDVPPGGIVVGRSAAWLHSGLGAPPLPVEIGVSGPATRWALPHRNARSMRIRPEHREVIGFGEDSVATLSAVATVLDLARAPQRPDDGVIMRAILDRRGATATEVFDALDRWTHLPGKRAVADRLRAVFGAQPPFTR
jgi:hypothetical protein